MNELTQLETVRELLEKRQYTALQQFLAELNIADIADCMDELSDEEELRVFRILPKDLAADVFAYLELENQQMIITSLTEKEAGNIIDNLMADDAVNLLEEMPASVVKKLLAHATPEVRNDINQLLRYPEDSAGSLMTVEYVDLKEHLTVAQAIDRIRRVGVDSETINVCYVLDSRRNLLGTVSLRRLLLSQADQLIGEIMHENVIAINTQMDQEAVANQFKKYDFTSMPVVDNENRLVGIITVDDVVDIMEEEATEDMEMMAAIMPGDKPYMRTSVWENFKKRIPWLLLLMVSSAFTGAIITSFEAALSVNAALIAFIPMLMGTGGNAGGQASVTVIRGLSMGEIEYGDVPGVMWKEIRVALLCGVCLAAANFGKLMLFDHSGLAVASAVSLTLIVVVLLAMFIGCILPVLAKRLGLDPAVMASPFITTVVDAMSLMVYFKVATIILKI